jgi:ubiquinone/menaquinone biosynthesis C-methylase UbiE
MLVPEEEKQKKVREVFDSVAEKYDLDERSHEHKHLQALEAFIAETGLKPGERARCRRRHC